MTNFHLFTQKLLTLDESSQEEAIKRFCKVFNEPIFNSFFENITKENITERSELSNVFNSILQEIAFKEIVKTIETISDEKDPKDSTGKTFVRTREDTLQRINTYVSSANTPDNTDFDSKGNVQYKPYLKKVSLF